MDEPAHRTPAAAARAELAAAGITVTPAGAARARRRRLDVLAAWPRARRLAVRRRALAAAAGELPPGDAAHHPAA